MFPPKPFEQIDTQHRENLLRQARSCGYADSPKNLSELVVPIEWVVRKHLTENLPA